MKLNHLIHLCMCVFTCILHIFTVYMNMHKRSLLNVHSFTILLNYCLYIWMEPSIIYYFKMSIRESGLNVCMCWILYLNNSKCNFSCHVHNIGLKIFLNTQRTIWHLAGLNYKYIHMPALYFDCVIINFTYNAV